MLNSADNEAPEISLTPGYNTHCGFRRKPPQDEKPKRFLVSWWTRVSNRGTWWDTIFVAACVIAVSLDPLFFYIPIIDRERKCLQADKDLKTVTLILRSIMDCTFVLHIIYQIREAFITAATDQPNPEDSNVSKTSHFVEYIGAVASNLSWSSIITDVLAVLPIPQLLLLVVFYKMRGPGYLDQRKVLNFFLLAQYLARIYRIYISSKKLTKGHGIWIKGVFNFFLYIFASHVLGAFWYFFSIQRETSCWHRNCVRKLESKECISNFYCDGYEDSQDMTKLVASLNTSCSIDKDGPFDFGIFLDSLRSNNTISTNFTQKLCFSFWWGLRNLSNFGTNLVTSNYVWENFFAIGISIIGLLLFLYLIGNVQTFMSMETEKSEEIRRKIKSKEHDMKMWMERNGVHENLRKEIMAKIREKLEEDKHADVENLFNILPWATKKSLKRVLCMSTLRNVPMLQGMNPKVLKMICDYLKPVIYPEHNFVAKVGEPVDRMVLVTEGTMWVYSSSSSSIRRIVESGGIYGDEQLLSWISENMQHVSYSNVPISIENVKCHTRVEGFAITAKDLKTVATKCKTYWQYDEEAAIGTATFRPAAAGRGAASVRPAAAGNFGPTPHRPAAPAGGFGPAAPNRPTPPAGGGRPAPHRPPPADGAANSPRARIEYLQRR